VTDCDLLVRGGRVAGHGVADVAVEGGRIVALGPALAVRARETVDAAALAVLPGAVDVHVHFNEPGRTHWEGWATGTAALAAGGATACAEMPLNAIPPTLDAAAFDAKLAAAERSSLVDFALWGGLVPGNVDRLPELAARGAIGVKAFMCDSGVPEFPPADEATLRAGMAQAAALGLPVAVHAEDPAHLRPGPDWTASRPVAAELAAIARALALAAETGCSLHVVHVSSGRGVALVAEARAAGVDATCETCPHYLVLTEDDLGSLGARAKCAPPLRAAEEREALWAHLAAGRIALVASDHSPAPPELKAGDLMTAWGGIAGAQATLELLLDAGRLELEAIAALTATRPAARFGLPKGALAVGADADLALVDLGAERTLRREELRDRHRLSPYVGRRLRARVVRTILRGVTVAREGRIVAAPPLGRHMRQAVSP